MEFGLKEAMWHLQHLFQNTFSLEYCVFEWKCYRMQRISANELS